MHTVRILKRVSYGLVTVVLGCTALAGDYQQRPVSPGEVRRQYTQDELSDRLQAESVDRARQATRSLHARALATQELFATIKQQAESFFTRMDTLLQSDEGKRIARDPIGTRMYQGLKDYPSVTLIEIKERAQAASALVNRLASLQSGPEVNFIPSQETQDQVDELYFWIVAHLKDIEGDVATLNDTVRRAPTDFDPANAKTLQVILEEMDAEFYRLLSEYRMQGEKKAARVVKQIVVDAAYLRRVENAHAEEQVRRKEIEAEVLRKQTQADTALFERMADMDRQLAEAKIRYDDAVAEIERLRKNADAARQIADSDEDIKRGTQLGDAERRKKIALAKSPDVARLLSPFLTPGYWQPGKSHPSYEKQPMSYAQIQAYGALTPMPKGLQQLLEIGIYHKDGLRPRWSFRPHLRLLSGPEHEQVLQAQKYLIDLGPLLIELGMLAP